MASKYRGNQVRIIAGQWRGRRVTLPDVVELRPTGDRIRETLFNWLQPELAGTRCLDLFAGSGVLGLEAASRGAASVVLVEQDPSVCRQLRATLVALHAVDDVTLVERDALAYLAGPPQPYDVVFLDPPFAGSLLPVVSHALHAGDWLAPGAKIYVERRADARDELPPWTLLKEKIQGKVRFTLYGNV
ncbi:MAG: 16S rRNA (guanine(966)-N(2))-methyltransferase RsmD [Gammaproteobacteria bacterium]|nr:16S rRNA (guanine(966)-N(2))-methyltransferase RsmD [Gammaproteobacteria bacterium]